MHIDRLDKIVYKNSKTYRNIKMRATDAQLVTCIE